VVQRLKAEKGRERQGEVLPTRDMSGFLICRGLAVNGLVGTAHDLAALYDEVVLLYLLSGKESLEAAMGVFGIVLLRVERCTSGVVRAVDL
jgi:hypothetical protein